MKKLLVLCLLLGLNTLWSAPGKILNVSFTSVDESIDPEKPYCIINGQCEGHWSPASKDYGVDEGITIRFVKNLPSTKISVEGSFIRECDKNYETTINSNLFQLFIGGQTNTEKNALYRQTTKLVKVDTLKGNGKRVKNRYHFKTEFNLSSSKTKKAKVLFFRVLNPTNNYSQNSDLRISKVDLHSKLEALHIVEAKVKASSVLSPKQAYAPENLFDSKTDYAWSTDGKTSQGVGETISIKLSKPVNIKGIIAWNGYQRSQKHFEANGSVKKIRLDLKNKSEEFALKKKRSRQLLQLKETVQGVQNIEMEILEVHKGHSYKDVLLSELALMDENGNVVQVIAPKAVSGNSSAENDEFLDRSFSNFILYDNFDGALEYKVCTQKKIRLRSDGSFVFYDKYHSVVEYRDNWGSSETKIREGNWKKKQGNIYHLFGRFYVSFRSWDEYMVAAKKKEQNAIFSSDLKITRWNNLNNKQKEKFFRYYFKNQYGYDYDEVIKWGNTGYKLRMATIKYVPNEKIDKEGVVAQFHHHLGYINPYLVESPFFYELVVPTDDSEEICGLR